jgi:glycosyltransferase involved in cell wall biosynthesis
MKILHVITTLDVGGAEMHLLAQVRGQRERGHEIRVVYLKGRGSLAPDFSAAGAEQVIALAAGPGLLFALRPHLRWADVVHSHLLKADMATAVAATLAGRRKSLVASKHNDEQVLRKPLVSFVHGVLGALPQRTIVLSDHVGRFIAEHGRVPLARQKRIYYGIDPRPFEAAAARPREQRDELRASLGLAADDIVFICVARFAAQKAHDVLLRAFAAANERDPKIRLLLVGDDPFGDGRVRAETLARELNLIPRAIFTGIRRDVPELLAASDVFVMASLWEGLGLVFLEAMAARLPVLATNVSAVPEVVLDGVTGVLVPPSDARALAETMVALARDPRGRAAFGAAGHARVLEHFGLERMIEATLAVYAGLPALEAARRPRR